MTSDRLDHALPPEGPLVEPAVLERVLGGALARGGDMAEVFVEDRQTSGASLDDRRVEELSSGHERGAGIRVVGGETTGFAHTADLSEEGLRAAAEAASAVARHGGGGVRPIALAGPRAGSCTSCAGGSSRCSATAVAAWRRTSAPPGWPPTGWTSPRWAMSPP